jgi:hypothetical protein
MIRSVLTLGILLTAQSVFAQPSGQLTGITTSNEHVVGACKVVTGQITGPTADGEHRPTAVTVWVNGISCKPDRRGQFRVMIPNEPLLLVEAFQPGLNVFASDPAHSGTKGAETKKVTGWAPPED